MSNQQQAEPYAVKITDGVYSVIHVTDNQEVWGHIANETAAKSLAARLNAGDQSVVLYGPMFCEEHRQTLWPHDDCAGPGVWLPNAELAERDIHPQGVEEVDFLFDGPPGPNIQGHHCNFIDTVTGVGVGVGVGVGQWIDRGDGTWALRVSVASDSIRRG